MQKDGSGDNYTYVAFSSGSLEAYLGHLERFNLTNNTLPSVYGDIGFRAFNMTEWGFKGTQIVMSVSGIRCSLYREQGLLNYTRVDSDNNSSNTWTISSTHFPKDQKKVNVPSFLTQFQWRGLNFHAPGSGIPGLGPALGGNSFEDFALKFLYASGETQRILYEVAASTNNATHNPPNSFVNVPGMMTQQRYRITYVPSILLVGLLCLLGAGVVTGTMALFARKSQSAQAHRRVNVVRLLVDSVAGLKDDGENMAILAQGGNANLDAWAAGYKVRYATVNDAEGTVQVVLEKHKGC